MVDTIKADYRKADIGDKDIGMLAYAEKLTRAPNRMSRGDVGKLRKLGFKDRDILDIAQVTAYFNYVNRLADGLGVELEPYWEESP